MSNYNPSSPLLFLAFMFPYTECDDDADHFLRHINAAARSAVTRAAVLLLNLLLTNSNNNTRVHSQRLNSRDISSDTTETHKYRTVSKLSQFSSPTLRMSRSQQEAICSFCKSLKWQDIARSCEMSVFALFIAISANTVVSRGLSGLAKYYVETLRKLPFVNSIISAVVANEVKGALTLLAGEDKRDEAAVVKMVTIPVSIYRFV